MTAPDFRRRGILTALGEIVYAAWATAGLATVIGGATAASALSSGFQLAFATGAALSVLGALASLVLLRQRRARGGGWRVRALTARARARP